MRGSAPTCRSSTSRPLSISSDSQSVPRVALSLELQAPTPSHEQLPPCWYLLVWRGICGDSTVPPPWPLRCTVRQADSNTGRE